VAGAVDLTEEDEGQGLVDADDSPAPRAALARRTDADPGIAYRFEAYVGGLELANAFGERTAPGHRRDLPAHGHLELANAFGERTDIRAPLRWFAQAQLELANAFGERTDPVEQRARFEGDLRLRAARGQALYPSTRSCSPRSRRGCRLQPVSPSASTASSCWRPARPRSIRSCRSRPTSYICGARRGAAVSLRCGLALWAGVAAPRSAGARQRRCVAGPCAPVRP